MGTTARARAERIEFRTTPELRRLVERAVDASDSTLTDFAEAAWSSPRNQSWPTETRSPSLRLPRLSGRRSMPDPLGSWKACDA